MESIKKNLNAWFPRLRGISAACDDVSDVLRCIQSSKQHANWPYIVQKKCGNEHLFKHDIPLNVIVDIPSDAIGIAKGHNFFFCVRKPPIFTETMYDCR